MILTHFLFYLIINIDHFSLELNEMRAEEAKEREAAYAKLAVEFDQDVVDALKEHFSIIYYPLDFYVFLE